MSVSNDAAKTVMLNALAAVVDRLSLHDGDPSTTGANEISGGSYARQACSWDAYASGARDLSADVTFDVPASTVAYIGLWNNGGTFYGYIAVTNEVFAGAGQYVVLAASTSLTLADA